MPAEVEPAAAMACIAPTCQPTSTRKPKRVRFTLPSGRVVCPRRVELAARDNVILATGAAVASKRAAGGDAVAEPGPSSGPAAQKRIVYRGGVPLKRFKGCRCIGYAADGEGIRGDPETSSQEYKLDVNRGLLSSANGVRTFDSSTVDDGFMNEIMAMADDECDKK